MKQAFWKKDWVTGLAICIVVIALGRIGLFDSLEHNAYDLGVQASSQNASDKIAVIAIDDVSIANIGRWPWSRNVHAEMQQLLTDGGARVIAQTVFFVEPQLDPGLMHIQQLLQFYANSELLQMQQKNPSISADIAELGNRLLTAEKDLNSDQTLANSLRASDNVILAMQMKSDKPIGRPDTSLPDYVSRNQFLNIKNNPATNPDNAMPLPVSEILYPIELLGREADSIGALSTYREADGSIRSEPLVLDYYNQMYPSLSLQIAMRSLNLGPDDVIINLGESVQLGGLTIKTNPNLLMNTFFYSNSNGPVFSVDSFYDVLAGKIPASKYKGKTVLIGATAVGVGNSMITPINASMAPVLTLAHSVSSILNEDFFIQPQWSSQVINGITLGIALYIILLLPRMNAALSTTVSLIILSALLVTHFTLMTSHGLWLQLMNPAILLVAGHILITSKRYLVTEKGKLALDAESAETNRMLGLSLQGQGQLDAAFEKFRRLPKSNEKLELLYNLALDFERKRVFNKAVSVYQVISELNPKFRDVKDRSYRAEAMDASVILGGASASSRGLRLDKKGFEKPMLGRYAVEKEIGKGAMGSVYLGRDPKIARIVAIKTMALAQEFEEDELQEVKARFFREAETAGRLSHPNIVTIYDAGEEHDLAYIAMEYLKGHDLVRYSKADNLLPVIKVMDIIRRAAEALHYAHQQNVVHRDIKPANVMYEAETDSLKITDFGIARITDSSKTKTGMVLGTPSYMSPEQLSGKKVDGRSDLFSLGVMMFQLVTGRLPFQGESMATLMFKIANEPHPKPDTIRPELPRCVTVIINRALAKDPEKRYQTGAQMASDLRKCMQLAAMQKKAEQQ